MAATRRGRGIRRARALAKDMVRSGASLHRGEYQPRLQQPQPHPLRRKHRLRGVRSPSGAPFAPCRAATLQGQCSIRMESAVFKDHPSLAEGKRRLLDAGCVAAAMSGSGPTLFGVCGSKSQATRISEALAESLPDCRSSVVSNVTVGVERA